MNAFFRIPDRSLTAYCDASAFDRLAPLHLYHGPNLLRKPVGAGGPLSTSDLLIAVKLEHEIDHLHRSLGTSFGLLIHRLHSAQVDSFFRHVATHATGVDVGLPLAVTGPSDALQTMWDCDLFAEALMCSLPKPRGVDLPTAERLAAFVPGLDPEVAAGEFSPGAKYAVPVVGYTLGATARTAALGGYALMEYLGLSREICLRGYSSLSPAGTEELVKTTGYQLAGQIWKRFAGVSDSDRNPIHSDLYTTYELALWLPYGPQGLKSLTSYVACELALWVPYGPQGLVAPPSGRALTWRDFHPGWRFLRLVEYLSGRSHPPSNLPLDEAYERWFGELEAEICAALDWPSPQLIASDWVPYLERGLARGTFDKTFIEDDGERARGSLAVLRRRLTHPAKAAHGYWSASNNTDLWFSVCSLFEPGGTAAKVFGMDLDGRDFRGAAYRFPPAVSLASALQLFARKRAEQSFGPELFSRYRMEGAGAAADVNIYARRHYGFGIVFGREDS